MKLKDKLKLKLELIYSEVNQIHAIQDDFFKIIIMNE